MAKVDLRGVDTDKGCSKPNCCTPSRALNRHHRRHEAMWLGIWATRRRGEARFRSLVNRYKQFLDEDVVRICVSHHAEIHAIYDSIILQDISALGKPLYKYSWREAEALMDKLEAACRKWELDDTPGINSRQYGSYRARRQAKRRRR